MMAKPTFELKFDRFKNLSKEVKEVTMQGYSSQNINKARKVWLDCFQDKVNLSLNWK